jgi:hypothetical protein
MIGHKQSIFFTRCKNHLFPIPISLSLPAENNKLPAFRNTKLNALLEMIFSCIYFIIAYFLLMH